jgi:hypothetical protein
MFSFGDGRPRRIPRDDGDSGRMFYDFGNKKVTDFGAHVASVQLSGQLSESCGFRETAGFDILYGGLAEEAFVLAVELTRALIPDLECRACGVKSFNQHSLARGN